jgi:hypothetical protein
MEQVLGSFQEDEDDAEGDVISPVADIHFEDAAVFDDNDESLELAGEERHPLLERATALLKEFYRVSDRSESRPAALDSLFRGAMETSGGLVQALSHTDEWLGDLDTRGLSIVQLKRALRGAAFVVGSLYQLGVEKVITEDEFNKFKAEIDSVQTEIVGMLKELRGKS